MDSTLVGKFKFTLALIAGPAVLFLGYLALITFIMSFGSTTMCLIAKGSGCLNVLPYLFWGIAGLLGVAAFWVGVFSASAMSRTRTFFIIGFLVCGFVACIPTLFLGLPSLFSFVASLAGLGGLLLGLLLLTSNPSFKRDWLKPAS
ncbi:MAG: hypothetical protein ACAH12_06965 [Methylophilaceae bacterium]